MFIYILAPVYSPPALAKYTRRYPSSSSLAVSYHPKNHPRTTIVETEHIIIVSGVYIIYDNTRAHK